MVVRRLVVARARALATGAVLELEGVAVLVLQRRRPDE
jgi:hypothetical protein